jgi:hypothetical protein
MQIALKKYFQKNFSLEGLNFKDFFKPHNSINTIAMLGAEGMPGINRKPAFKDAPNLLRQIRIVVWKATSTWQLSNCSMKYGEAFFIKSSAPSLWTPDSVLSLYITLDERKLAKSKLLDNEVIPATPNREVSFICSASASSASAPVNNKNGLNPSSCKRALDKPTVCFYGHTTTSAYRRGKPSWHFSPTPPWPAVPPDRPLCQKCYLYHRSAFLKGNSMYDFPHLYLYQKNNINPPNTGGACSSSSTERPPG